MTSGTEIGQLEVEEVEVPDSSPQCFDLLNKRKLFSFGICYTICFLLTFGLSLGIQSGAVMPLYIYRGFDLNDTSIGYPHMSSRVSGNENIILTLALLFIALVTKTALDRRGSVAKGLKDNVLVVLKRFKSLEFIFEVLIILYGCIVTNFLTNATKSFAGVLKPHFLAECVPNATLVNELERNGSSWVDEDLTKIICTGYPGDKFMDYRRGFPSGHTTQASYTMVMAILVVHSTRMGPEFFPLKGLIQLLLVLYLNFISFDRIKDHHHNWTDVLAGVIGGGVIALFVWYGYAKKRQRDLFCKSKRK